MSTRRLSIVLMVLAAAGGSPSSSVDACCLTDWLFGRTPTPYAVGYTPYAAGYTPYSAGYAPPQVLTTPVGQTPYAANYASGYTALPLTTPAATSGVFQAQRPAYFNNPSVYTGLPTVGTAQAAYSAPVTAGYRGAPADTTSYFGAANTYPRTTITAARPLLTAPGYPTANAYPTGAPATALPATNVAPLFPNAPAPRVGGGLSRFFGSLFGTNYNTSYYSAPITYYRPVTTVDPTLGTAVTVQQPCTSTVEQVQRTPYSSLQFGQPTTVTPGYEHGSTTCQTQPGYYGPPPTSQSQVYGQAPMGAVNQVGGVNQTGGVSQAGGYYGQPSNAAPLSGSPSSPRPQSGSGDLAPLDQPRLETFRPTQPAVQDQTMQPADSYYRPAIPSTDLRYDAPESTSESVRPASEPPKSYWQLQDADNSTAMIRERAGSSHSIKTSSPDPISLSVPSFTSAKPIPAPETSSPSSEPSPFELRDRGTSFDAPPLPPARRSPPADTNNVSNRPSWSQTPVREVGLVRQQSESRPAAQTAPQPRRQPARDKRWFTVQP